MKNAEKIMLALKKAFPGHKVEKRFIEENYNMESIFVDGKCIGLFYEDFFQKDYDNPKIEITIKAPLKYFENFIKHAGYITYIRLAVEEGVKKWEKESLANN